VDEGSAHVTAFPVPKWRVAAPKEDANAKLEKEAQAACRNVRAADSATSFSEFFRLSL
jgi:hypothetical protein